MNYDFFNEDTFKSPPPKRPRSKLGHRRGILRSHGFSTFQKTEKKGKAVMFKKFGTKNNTSMLESDFESMINRKTEEMFNKIKPEEHSYSYSASSTTQATKENGNPMKIKTKLAEFDRSSVIADSVKRYDLSDDKIAVKKSNVKGYIFKDNGNKVAEVVVRNNEIEKLDVEGNYMGRGLINQLIDLATTELKGTKVKLDQDDPKIKAFIKNGFKISYTDDNYTYLEKSEKVIKEDLMNNSNNGPSSNGFVNSQLRPVYNGNSNSQARLYKSTVSEKSIKKNSTSFNRLDLRKSSYGKNFEDPTIDTDDDFDNYYGKNYIDR